ncbi:MAG: N-acetylmuramoyl-L-alanine amidase [Actinomycetota bacterium]|nr:N-acetylmuramoyl-L-alanine amidase [Actinomycetota bacterium]
MKLVSRRRWGARPPRCRDPLPAARVRGLAVHYSASNGDERASHEKCAARVRAIQRFHQEERGFCDIAYSFVFCKHGFVFVGRGWGVRTAAQGTNFGNDHYHAACFLGDDTAGRDDVTRRGRQALAQLVLASRRRFGDEVRPHSSFKATGCPGDDLRRTIRFGDWHRLAGVPFPTLRRGRRGPEVRVAQRLLRRNRFRENYRPGPIDGIFGRRTAAACRRAKWALGYPRFRIRPTFGDPLHDFLTGDRRLPDAYRRRRRRRKRAQSSPPEALMSRLVPGRAARSPRRQALVVAASAGLLLYGARRRRRRAEARPGRR